MVIIRVENNYGEPYVDFDIKYSSWKNEYEMKTDSEGIAIFENTDIDDKYAMIRIKYQAKDHKFSENTSVSTYSNRITIVINPWPISYKTTIRYLFKIEPDGLKSEVFPMFSEDVYFKKGIE